MTFVIYILENYKIRLMIWKLFNKTSRCGIKSCFCQFTKKWAQFVCSEVLIDTQEYSTGSAVGAPWARSYFYLSQLYLKSNNIFFNIFDSFLQELIMSFKPVKKNEDVKASPGKKMSYWKAFKYVVLGCTESCFAETHQSYYEFGDLQRLYLKKKKMNWTPHLSQKNRLINPLKSFLFSLQNLHQGRVCSVSVQKTMRSFMERNWLETMPQYTTFVW